MNQIHTNIPQRAVTEAQAVAEIEMRAQAAGKIYKQLDGLDYTVLVPPGWTLESVDAVKTPNQIVRYVQTRSTESFIAYMQRWKQESTEYFYAPEGHGVVAIVDAQELDGEFLCFENHSVRLDLKTFANWDELIQKNKTRWTQVEFARFIENNRMFIKSVEQGQYAVTDDGATLKTPTAGQMRMIARNFRITRNMKLKTAVDLENGDSSFQFINQTTNESDDVTMPEWLHLQMKAYEGSTERIPVWLRLSYDVDGNTGALSLSYEIADLSDVMRFAFEQEIAPAKKALEGLWIHGDRTMQTDLTPIEEPGWRS